MARWLKISGIVLLSLASAFWLLLAYRLAAFVLFTLFIGAVVMRRGRRHPAVPAVLWLIFFGATWLPFDITLRAAPDGPKFVQCCPGIPYRYDDLPAVKEKDRRGDCRICSDVVTGFEAKYFLVW